MSASSSADPLDSHSDNSWVTGPRGHGSNIATPGIQRSERHVPYPRASVFMPTARRNHSFSRDFSSLAEGGEL
ncbi:MAG: hypothetical protein ACR2JT_05025 [Nocardioidaceae bacterium]